MPYVSEKTTSDPQDVPKGNGLEYRATKDSIFLEESKEAKSEFVPEKLP
jgi:hypothetical protein